ncbi:hypothetical protein ACFL4P_01660, partial [Gemmatimonadota bacterium]
MRPIVITILFLAGLTCEIAMAQQAPVFSRRDLVDRQGDILSYERSSTQFDPDSILQYYEGDSLLIRFFALDPDGTEDVLSFSLEDWGDFVHRPGNRIDSLALADTSTILESGVATGFEVRLQLAFNVADSKGLPDTLIVGVTDGTHTALDTMLFRVANTNRAPIWDQDTSSKPSDSALTWAYDPVAVEPDSIEELYEIAGANNAIDSIYFQQYVYDPDSLIGDMLGPVITVTQSGSPADIFDPAGLMILAIYVTDTASYKFTVKATDSDPDDPQMSTQDVILRVIPYPDISSIYPVYAAPGDAITIHGNGFGLFDIYSPTPSTLIFRARDSSGVAQNLPAKINSWTRERINLTIPGNVPVSRWIASQNAYLADTIEVRSSVSAEPEYYPYIITELDTMTISDLELVNLTPTSATIQWKTRRTGPDSIIVTTLSDTLDIFSDNFAAPAAIGGFWPTFVVTDYTATPPALSTVKSSVVIFRGQTSPTDQLHNIQLTGLIPETGYRFLIAAADNIFYGDTLHNINGPWFSAKIDRTNQEIGTSEINERISGFLLQTPPLQSSIGEPFAIAGMVFTDLGAATNALVTVKVVHFDNPADTSLGLSTTVGADGTWEINLGNAMGSVSGGWDSLFTHNQGDYLLITIQGDDDEGYRKLVEVRASMSPQLVGGGETQLWPLVEYDVPLKIGFNLIGLPVEP